MGPQVRDSRMLQVDIPHTFAGCSLASGTLDDPTGAPADSSNKPSLGYDVVLLRYAGAGQVITTADPGREVTLLRSAKRGDDCR